MNKKLIVVLFGVLFAFAAANNGTQNFTVDEASNILHELLEGANQGLANLRSDWETLKPLLEQGIADLEGELHEKQEQCSELDDVLADRQQKLRDAEDYAAWLVKRIHENEERIKDTLVKRCAQNGEYIEGLKNDKLALKLLQFIRLQIEHKESFSLAQRKAFTKNLHNFLQVYKTGSLADLILLEKQYVDSAQYDVNSNYEQHDRTASEIGSDHVDNNFGDIVIDDFKNGQRKGWVQVREELLQLLQNLENTIREKIANAQEDEVNASVATSDYKIQLEHEIETYQAQLVQWRQLIVELTNSVAKDEENVRQCRHQEAAISSQLQSARDDLAERTAVFEHKQSGLEEEVSVFGEVIALYDETTTNQGDDFKARADDYIEDQNFDNGQYDDREVTKIDLLSSF